MTVGEENIDIEGAKNSIAEFIYSTKNTMGKIILFLAIGGMFIDAWDFSAVSIVTYTFKATFHPTSQLLGLAVGAANIGAVVGAVLGGYFTDRFGRRTMFISNMILFVVMAILAGISTDIWQFIIFRILLGFALGADVATGFVYLFEFTERKQRINYSSAWAYIWSIMFLFAIFVAFILVSLIGNSTILWRIMIILGAIFALIILLLRSIIPESALWYAYKGQFKNAKEVIKKWYNVDLATVPNVNLNIKRTVNIKDIVGIFRLGYNRIFSYSWTQNILVAFSFWGFAFYVPYLVSVLHLSSSIYGTLTYDTFIWLSALVGAIISPYIIKIIGIKHTTTITSFLMGVSFLFIFLTTEKMLPITTILPAAILVNFLLFLGPMTFFTIVNPAIPSRYKGIANGWTYTINKATAVAASLFGASIITAIGLSGNTIFLAILALFASTISAIFGVDTLKFNPIEVEKSSKEKISKSGA